MGFLRQGIFSLLFVLVACALHAVGQTNPQNNQTTFRVEGAVVNSVTGQPVPRALVQIISNPQVSVLSGANGEFSFDTVPKGKYSVLVMKPGFCLRGCNSPNSTLPSLEAGPEVGNVVLKLVPEAVIYGQVTGTDAEPVEGVTIEVLASHRSHKTRSLAPFFRNGLGSIGPNSPMVQTDDEGNYRISGLPPGTYYLTVKTGNVSRRMRAVQTRGMLRAGADSLDYPASVYYPGVTDFEAAMPIKVTGGQRVAADFSLKKVPTFKVTGVVKAAQEWKQINPPMIVDASDEPLFVADDFESATGSFTFKAIPAGTYRLQLGGMDQNGLYARSYRKLTVSGPATGLKFVLGRTLDIPVVVHNELTHAQLRGRCASTGPDGQMRTSDCSDYLPISMELLAADSHGVVYSGFGPQPDPNDIRLRAVMAGKYWVKARAQFGGYVQSLRSGSIDLLSEPLVVPDEGDVAPIEVTLRDDTSQLKLTVRASSPARSGWAILIPEVPGGDPFVLDVNASTDRVYTLPPGNYTVFAVDSMDGMDISDPESLDPYSDKTTSITLSANGAATVSVDVLRTGG